MQFSVNSIVVVGGGTAGWSAAAMLAERFKKSDLKIHLIESPEISSVGVGEATVPGILSVHKNLKLSETEFIKATNATFKLGIKFCDWNSLGGEFFHPFSQFGTKIGPEDFHQYWIKAKQSGLSFPLEDFSLCASLAKAGRFSLPDNNSNNPLAWYGYAYHFDATLYANFLREYALDRNVTRISDTVISVEKNPENGFIKTLNLKSGSSIDADFFIDCSGLRSRLLAEEMGSEYIDWSKWLPCDRAVVVQTESDGTLLPYTTSTAMDAGWRWRIPLQNRIGNGYVYSSSYVDDEKAKASLLDALSEPCITMPRVIRFKTGMRKEFWVKNCVGIGLSSGFVEPLESTSISLMHTGIDKIIAHMPNLKVTEEAVASANNLNRLEFERIRDFIILHYWASKRDDTAFWRDVRSMHLPDLLQNKLDSFMCNGALVQYEQESFREPSWLAMYNGFNVLPKSNSVSIEEFSSQQLAEVFNRMKSAIELGVSYAPSHLEFLKTVYE